MLEKEKQFTNDVQKDPKLMFSLNHRAKVFGFDPKDPKVILLRFLNAALNIYILWWIYNWWTGGSDKKEEEDNNTQKSPSDSSAKVVEEDNIYAKLSSQQKQE